MGNMNESMPWILLKEISRVFWTERVETHVLGAIDLSIDGGGR